MKIIFTLILNIILFYQYEVKAQITNVQGPAGSGEYSHSITILSNGNYVVADPYWDNGSLVDVGAVYLYDGATHALISTLTGSRSNDQVGFSGIKVLSNGNYLVLSPRWNNGVIESVGAVTWVNGATGINGVVNASNSLIGTLYYDSVGSSGVVILKNGNYVVLSASWDNGTSVNAGAATWANGSTGITGFINASNSLIGSQTYDQIGYEFVALANDNYLILSPSWRNGTIPGAGSVTWGSAASGVRGVVSASNSLVGSNASDMIGTGFNISILSSGNYVVKTPGWDNGAIIDAGAITWGNGATGTSGKVGLSNSLTGSSAYDLYESSVTVLTNGNYLVQSPYWDNGAITNVGAVTWGNGNTGLVGAINETNSLVGFSSNDWVGRGIITLTNGNYVVQSPQWDNGLASNAGASTWGNGTTGTAGVVTTLNSLVGVSTDDAVGINGMALTNGNYVLSSPDWTNINIPRAGAATFGNGETGTIGNVSSSNSLVGSSYNDRVGFNIIPLTNGNYVVRSTTWSNGSKENAGAVTWGNGTTGIHGTVNSSNSLVGSKTEDRIGNWEIAALPNGNYVICSSEWDNGDIFNAGAATWGNGATGTSGELNVSNSLIGSKPEDRVSTSGITALVNGNYLVKSSSWGNEAALEAGAITWGNGATGISGIVGPSNSLVGTKPQNRIGSRVTVLSNGNYLASSMSWDNGSVDEAGAITWLDGEKNTSGEVNSSNSLVGTNAYDRLGYQIFPLANGDYVLLDSFWNNGAVNDAGAITWGSGKTALSGMINECRSYLGNTESAGLRMYFYYNEIYDYLLISNPGENLYGIYKPFSLPNENVTVTETVNNSKVSFLKNCEPIASLTPDGVSPVNGAVTAKVTIRPVTNLSGKQPYVRRHQDMTSEINNDIATGKLTLYYSQEDFDDFNSNRAIYPALPTGPADVSGIANLRITQNHGTSDTGLPNSYTNWTGAGPSTIIINPLEKDIIWNGVEKRWEIRFSVTGFSGFFVHTTFDESPLPVHLITFEAKQVERDALLSWKTVAEVNASHFEIERSTDAKTFVQIGKIQARGNSSTDQNYSFNDVNFSLSDKTVYYRLKSEDLDGSFSISKIVSLNPDQLQPVSWVFPNPAKGGSSVTLHTQEELNGISVCDVLGRAINLSRFSIAGNKAELDLSGLGTGVYFVKFMTKTGMQIHKLVVE